VAPLGAALAKRGSFQVIASGLDNPRGIAIGPDRAIYVAEAGRGGDGECITNGAGARVCFGRTGAITRIADGQATRIIRGLPSVASAPDSPAPGTQADGPHGIVFDRAGRGTATLGLGADPRLRGALGRRGLGLASLLRFTIDGENALAENLGDYEIANNPAGGTIDSNPFGIAGMGGALFVADAGANDLLKVENGVISTVAVFENRMVTGPGGVPIPMQPVPTSVAVGPDNALYVGQLTGFPFPVGGANVYRVVPGSAPEVFATGFTNIIGIAFDRQGALYVLEISHNSLLSGNPVGALFRVVNGEKEELVPGTLISPGGMAIARDGSIYVSRFATLPNAGDVVRIRP
jgi:hypothetical protein